MRGWTAVLVVVACNRQAPSLLHVDAAADAEALTTLDPSNPSADWPVASAPPQTSLAPPTSQPPTAPAPPGEARRTAVPTLDRDPLMRAQLSTLRAHFGADARGPFAVQRIERAGGGSALLVTRADESDPIVLAVDRDHLVFVREHPTGGITPPAEHLTISPGPERGVALFAWVSALHLVAARLWADDGNPYAEIVTFTLDSSDACDALTAAYRSQWGWILACSSKNGTRAQLLREDLTVAWGSEGAVVGVVGPVDRAAIEFDTPTTWVLRQRVRAVGGDRATSFRYGRDAGPQSGDTLRVVGPPSAGPQPMPSSSTSNTSVESGGITGGKPRAP